MLKNFELQFGHLASQQNSALEKNQGQEELPTELILDFSDIFQRILVLQIVPLSLGPGFSLAKVVLDKRLDYGPILDKVVSIIVPVQDDEDGDDSVEGVGDEGAGFRVKLCTKVAESQNVLVPLQGQFHQLFRLLMESHQSQLVSEFHLGLSVGVGELMAAEIAAE